MSYRFKRALALFIVIILFLNTNLNIGFLNVSAAPITILYIEGTDVNVRSGPSTSFGSIGQLSNTSRTVIETVNSNGETWYKIQYNDNKVGFIKHASWTRISVYNPDASFEENLKAFPESYHNALRGLHAIYPNWKFIPDSVSTSFDEAVYQQSINMRKQVNFSSQPVSWRSMGQGSYDWSLGQWVQTNGGWTGASKEIIAYYMDPRNFLNSSAIYQFLQQSYNPATQTAEGLQKIINGTFLNQPYSDPNDTEYGGSYHSVIMAAAAQSNVSPYIIAAKIIQEQSPTSSLISGTHQTYPGFYNFLNIGASGSTNADVVNNGLKRAKQEGWNTRSKSIIGGAKFLSNSYISAGQSTYYYQDFNVLYPDKLWHQYAQAVHDAYNKGVNLSKTYKDATDLPLDFRIPVFSSMPDTPAPKPESNSKTNNYYFKNISVSGLTPSFSMYNNSYDLNITGNTTIYISLVNGAAYAGHGSYKILPGINTINLPVKSETGFINNYSVNVNSNVECTLYVDTGTPPITVANGDVNGDGKISITDLALVRMYLLDLTSLSGDGYQAADVNNDGKITITDLALVRMHLLGLTIIS